jgi:hypothetical protein
MKMKKILVGGIILLFIGVAVAPNIHLSVVKAAADDELVEVTAQACGIQGYGDTTVKLTNEQYQNLQQFLVTFRARLNQTTTREETAPIFKEAVVELHKYGLLPKGMSIRDAQRLVLRGNQEAILQQPVGKMIREKMLNDSTNILCLVAGYSNNTQISTLFEKIVLFNFLLISTCMKIIITSFITYLYLGLLLVGITMFFFALDSLFPFTLWSDVNIYRGNGFLYSVGLGGAKKWVGTLNGHIQGFTGIKILLNFKDPFVYFYLGSGLSVTTETETGLL